MTEDLLSVESVDLSYGPAQALRGVSVHVKENETLTVLGANGAGKSSLARACSGLVPISSGQITFCGETITGWPPHRIRRAGLVYAPEGRGVLQGLSVIDNLRMAVGLCPRRERGEALGRVFDLFPVLDQRRSQRAGSLSGGEQQMLSLARALAVPPRLMIADELSLGLAPKIVDQVFASLERAKAMGVTIVLIEQYVQRALAVSDKCVILRRGEVAWSGKASEAADAVLTHYMGEETSYI